MVQIKLRAGLPAALWLLGLGVKVPLCSILEGAELGGAQRPGTGPAP